MSVDMNHPTTKTCDICGAKHAAKGLCLKHYKAKKSAERYLRADKAAHAAKTAAWRAANPEKARALWRASHARAKEKRNQASREYRAANLDHMRAAGRAWARANLDRAGVYHARRRSAKMRGRMLRETEFDSLFLREIYSLAKMRTLATGVVWHVDHRVPLTNPIVSGLHCAANLQLITAQENHSKGNRVWEHMPS